MICERCGDASSAYICSHFNVEMLCTQCKDDEKGCPNWQKAYDTEFTALKNHNYNFAGIGLAPEDLAYLEQLRIQRG
jgi:hypothetical protein